MTPPPAVLAPSVALERLENEWRKRWAGAHMTGDPQIDAITDAYISAGEAFADELATLRAGLAQQGEAVATFTVTNCGPCLPDLDMEWLSDYRTFAGKGPQLLFTHPAAVDGLTLERYANNSADWNGCHGQAIKALRYLAKHGRCPDGGEQFPNMECCQMIADELEKSFGNITAALLPDTSEGENNGR